MAHLEFDIETDLAPERVISALTDFTERRPQLWPELRPGDYRVDAAHGARGMRPT